MYPSFTDEIIETLIALILDVLFGVDVVNALAAGHTKCTFSPDMAIGDAFLYEVESLCMSLSSIAAEVRSSDKEIVAILIANVAKNNTAMVVYVLFSTFNCFICSGFRYLRYIKEIDSNGNQPSRKSILWGNLCKRRQT